MWIQLPSIREEIVQIHTVSFSVAVSRKSKQTAKTSFKISFKNSFCMKENSLLKGISSCCAEGRFSVIKLIDQEALIHYEHMFFLCTLDSWV